MYSQTPFQARRNRSYKPTRTKKSWSSFSPSPPASNSCSGQNQVRVGRTLWWHVFTQIKERSSFYCVIIIGQPRKHVRHALVGASVSMRTYLSPNLLRLCNSLIDLAVSRSQNRVSQFRRSSYCDPFHTVDRGQCLLTPSILSVGGSARCDAFHTVDWGQDRVETTQVLGKELIVQCA